MFKHDNLKSKGIKHKKRLSIVKTCLRINYTVRIEGSQEVGIGKDSDSKTLLIFSLVLKLVLKKELKLYRVRKIVKLHLIKLIKLKCLK